MSAWIPELSDEDSDAISLFASVYTEVDLTTLLILIEDIRHRAWDEAAAQFGRVVEPEDKPASAVEGADLLDRARQLIRAFRDDDESLAHAIAVMVAAEVYKATTR